MMNENLARPRLVIAVNSAIAVGFLQGQLQFFHDRGFDVTVLCPKRRKNEWEVERPEGVPIIEVPLEREIAPLQDLASLWRLGHIMLELLPTLTNVGSPNAAVVRGFSAWL